MDEIAKLLGKVFLYSTGASAIAVAIFKLLGEKWLSSKFEQQLAAHKYRLDTLFDRAVKSHQREFEVLPEAWGKIVESYHQVRAFVSPLQQVPDVNRMTDEQLEELLKESKLAEWQKAEIRTGLDKTKIYRDHLFWRRLFDAEKTASEAHVYVLKHGIFFPPELEAKFEAIDNLIWDALNEHEHNKRYSEKGGEFLNDKGKALRSKGDEMLKELKAELRSRLWKSESERES